MFEIYHDSFKEILGEKPALHLLADGFKLTEGPVYLSGPQHGYLLFTDQKTDSIYVMNWYGLHPFNQLSALSFSKAALFRAPASITNGMTADLEGRLVMAEAGGRRITRMEPDGTIHTLVDAYNGKKFNSPNDVIVKSDGTIWFTDPDYGALGFGSLSSREDCELPNSVYCFDPKSHKIHPVISDVKSPNGLAFSSDEQILYVADSGACQGYSTYYEYFPHAIYAYKGPNFSHKELFCEIAPGFPDGIRLDQKDNLYIGAGDGVHVYSREGQCLGKINLQKPVTNLTFGGEENNVLFICAIDSMYAIKTNAIGTKKIHKIRGKS